MVCNLRDVRDFASLTSDTADDLLLLFPLHEVQKHLKENIYVGALTAGLRFMFSSLAALVESRFQWP